MRKLTILSATLLSSALILSACSSASEKKEETNKQTSTSSSSETKATQAFDFTAMDKDEKTVKVIAEEIGVSVSQLEAKIASIAEFNPMMGHRGCRLGITKPEIYKMQTEAIFRSAIKLHQQGQEIKPEIMVPLIADQK